MEFLKSYADIILNISKFDIIKSIKHIKSLSELNQYSYVKIKNLVKNTEYNQQIGIIINDEENNRFPVQINKKKLNIKKENLELYPIILYLKLSDVDKDKQVYYNIGFNIPIIDNQNILAIFYKGDIFFDEIKNYKKVKLDRFFNEASYETTINCYICNDNKLRLISCKSCVNKFCEECFHKFQKKECPYCKTPIEYDKYYI